MKFQIQQLIQTRSSVGFSYLFIHQRRKNVLTVPGINLWSYQKQIVLGNAVVQIQIYWIVLDWIYWMEIY